LVCRVKGTVILGIFVGYRYRDGECGERFEITRNHYSQHEYVESPRRALWSRNRDRQYPESPRRALWSRNRDRQYPESPRCALKRWNWYSKQAESPRPAPVPRTSCAPRCAPVLEGPGFPEPASPFQSSRPVQHRSPALPLVAR